MKYKNYLYAACAAIALVCLFVFFRSCDDTPPVKQLPIPVENKVSAAKLDSLEKINRQLESDRKSKSDSIRILLSEKKATEALMIRADKELKKFIDRGNQAKIAGDVAAELEACDSLKHAVVEARGVVVQYQNGMDELLTAWSKDNEYCQQQIEVQKNQIDILTADKSSLQVDLVDLTGKYNQLATDFNKQLKKKKRERTLSRILSLLLLSTTAAFAITN